MPIFRSELERQGFTSICSSELIKASFYSLHVFLARGLKLRDADLVTRTLTIADVQPQIIFSKSVNEACQFLIGDDYTNDEEQWAKEHDCCPPYILIQIGPTYPHTADVERGLFQADGNKIITHNAFNLALQELKEMRDAVLPSVVMALECVFSAQGYVIDLLPVDDYVFGITATKAIINEVFIDTSATGYISKTLSNEDLDIVMRDAETLVASIQQPKDDRLKVAQFFYMGFREKDNLKRFLFYFLAVEIEVHRAFKKVTAEQHVMNTVTIESRVAASLRPRLVDEIKKWKGLTDKFIFCVASVWNHMNDSDISEFKRLKEIRDNIAHGSFTAEPEVEDVKAIEGLAKKIHRYSQFN